MRKILEEILDVVIEAFPFALFVSILIGWLIIDNVGMGGTIGISDWLNDISIWMHGM